MLGEDRFKPNMNASIDRKLSSFPARYFKTMNAIGNAFANFRRRRRFYKFFILPRSRRCIIPKKIKRNRRDSRRPAPTKTR
jgi:hypothetical protein